MKLLKNKKCFSRIESVRSSQKYKYIHICQESRAVKFISQSASGGAFSYKWGPWGEQIWQQKNTKSRALGKDQGSFWLPALPSLIANYDFYTQNKC